MQEVEKIAIRKALRTLDVVKDSIQYAVEFDGVTYGNRTLAVVKKTQRKPRYPYGTTRKHYVPFINTIKDGGKVSVPFGMFDGSVLAANISAYCVHQFGRGSATVHKNDATKQVEVLVVPNQPQMSAIERSLADIWGDDEA